jgi:predicted naringenin-chalcone synthase
MGTIIRDVEVLGGHRAERYVSTDDRDQNDTPARHLQPRILAVGTANPPDRYTQQQILDLYGITDRRISALFRSSHIRQRHLILPDPNPDGSAPEESNQQLLEKHRTTALEIGAGAIRAALDQLSLTAGDVSQLTCVTSTGFLCPGLSALFIKELGLRKNVARVDIVGMGCNAGLNSLQCVANYCELHPGKVGLMVCAEICSAIYVFDDSVSTAVVNSLFGDGVAVAVIGAGDAFAGFPGPTLLGFESEIIVSAIDAMRFDMAGTKFSFQLDPHIPYVIGSHVEQPVDRLLDRFGLKRRDIQHWLVHSGGRKVIDAIKYNLGISDYDVRHTKSILRDYGNLSSGSFLFSYERLLREEVVRDGDLGVMITMGPGSTIETCLVKF